MTHGQTIQGQIIERQMTQGRTIQGQTTERRIFQGERQMIRHNVESNKVY
jgi:hypothetical protein